MGNTKSKNDKFSIALLQLSFGKNPDDNLKKAVSWVEKAAKKGANVICLPELFRSQYFCQTEDIANFKLAETVPGPSTEAVSKIAKKYGAAVIVLCSKKS